jgi:D-alanyl-D-alanine carboxypeptidase/D-alanyl-D-alanine-endopeptidase (penicillin-binding protein 4)
MQWKTSTLRSCVYAFCVLISGCTIFRPIGRPSEPVAALRYDVERVLSDSIFIPCIASIKIVSLDSKDVLYEHDSRLLMRHASNMKLLTSSTALHSLGKNYRFKTSVLADTLTADSVVSGNLYLKGAVDPDLNTEDLDTLAAQVQLRGIRKVKGGVIADVSFFDDLYWGYGWEWDDEPYSYAAFISPIAVNKNCVTVTVTPGQSAGDTVKVDVNPRSSFVSLINRGRTVRDTVLHPLGVNRLFKERLNTVVIDGEMLTSSNPVVNELTVWKPELNAAFLFAEALRRHGVILESGPASAELPSTAYEIAFHEHGLDSTLFNMNKVSDNLSAEMILKTLGAVKRGVPGKAMTGVYVVNEFLSSLGIDTTRFVMVDGSGLSYHDLLTAEMIVQLLEGMTRQTEVFPLFYESLPIAGFDGTLRNRMKRTPAEGNLRAKTGSLSGVSSLSGYVRTLDGELLAFSMIMQNFMYPSRFYQRAQDKIGALLAGFSRLGRTPPPQR